ncbi:MAG: hypothetical protein LBC86_08450 [Oscillospiraceae bacterium]|nr:hypothetical protein [Oscillospiraceae bacterium]
MCLKNELGTNPPQEEGMVINMSLAVAVKSGGMVYVGADSLVSWNNTLSVTNESQSKLWKIKGSDAVFAHSGWVVDSNIISMSDEIIDEEYTKKAIKIKDVVNNITPKIMALLESRGRIENQAGIKKMHSQFLLAHKNRVFMIETDGCVIEPNEDYISIGSGAVIADGVYQAIKDDERLSPQQKIVKIITCACVKDAWVNYPIKILNTRNDEVITIKNETAAKRFTAVR